MTLRYWAECLLCLAAGATWVWIAWATYPY